MLNNQGTKAMKPVIEVMKEVHWNLKDAEQDYLASPLLKAIARASRLNDAVAAKLGATHSMFTAIDLLKIDDELYLAYQNFNAQPADKEST